MSLMNVGEVREAERVFFDGLLPSIEHLDEGAVSEPNGHSLFNDIRIKLRIRIPDIPRQYVPSLSARVLLIHGYSPYARVPYYDFGTIVASNDLSPGEVATVELVVPGAETTELDHARAIHLEPLTPCLHYWATKVAPRPLRRSEMVMLASKLEEVIIMRLAVFADFPAEAVGAQIARWQQQSLPPAADGTNGTRIIDVDDTLPAAPSDHLIPDSNSPDITGRANAVSALDAPDAGFADAHGALTVAFNGMESTLACVTTVDLTWRVGVLISQEAAAAPLGISWDFVADDNDPVLTPEEGIVGYSRTLVSVAIVEDGLDGRTWGHETEAEMTSHSPLPEEEHGIAFAQHTAVESAASLL